MTATTTYLLTFPQLRQRNIPAIVSQSDTDTAFVVLTGKDAVIVRSDCALIGTLFLLRRERDGEVCLTLPSLDEHGFGSTEEEAKENLWESLCQYRKSLEQSTLPLSPSLAHDLARLRQFIRNR